MSLPPVVVELRGSIGHLKSSLGEAQRDIEKLSKSGAGSLDKMAAVGKGALLGLTGAFVTLGAVGVKQAAEQAAATAVLRTSIENTGHTWAEYADQVDKAEAAARKKGFADDEATASMARLAQATHSPTLAIKDQVLAMDIARGRNIGLAEATDLLAKVQTGHVALLGRLGINVKDATGATIGQDEAVKRLAATYGGSASAYAQTFAGKLAVVKAQGDELAESFGNLLIPAIEKVGSGAVSVTGFLDRHRAVAVGLGTAVAGVLVPAMGAYVAMQIRSAAVSTVKNFRTLATDATNAASKLGLMTKATDESSASLTRAGVAGSVGMAAVGVGIALVTTKMVQQRAEAAKWAQGWIAAGGVAGRSTDEINAKAEELWQKSQKGRFDIFGQRSWSSSARAAGKDLDQLKNEVERNQAAQRSASVAADRQAQSEGFVSEEAKKASESIDKLKATTIALADATKSQTDANAKVTTASDTLAAARAKVNELVKAGTVDLKAVTEATKEHQRAAEAVTRATDAQRDAQQALDGILHPSARTQEAAALGQAAAHDAVERATMRAADAATHLGKINADGKSTAADRETAQLDLADAQRAVVQATWDAEAADRAVSDLLPENITSTDAYKTANERLADATKAVADAHDAETASADKLREAQAGDKGLIDAITQAKKDEHQAEIDLTAAKTDASDKALKHAEAVLAERDAYALDTDAVAGLRAEFEKLLATEPGAAGAVGNVLAALPASPSSAGGHGAAPAYQRGGVRLMARGGDAMAGEMAWVGENGPELVEFSRPAHVYPTGTGPVSSSASFVAHITVNGAGAPEATGRAVAGALADFAHRNGFRVPRSSSFG